MGVTQKYSGNSMPGILIEFASWPFNFLKPDAYLANINLQHFLPKTSSLISGWVGHSNCKLNQMQPAKFKKPIHEKQYLLLLFSFLRNEKQYLQYQIYFELVVTITRVSQKRSTANLLTWSNLSVLNSLKLPCISRQSMSI